jgi:hypothetical protein
MFSSLPDAASQPQPFGSADAELCVDAGCIFPPDAPTKDLMRPSESRNPRGIDCSPLAPEYCAGVLADALAFFGRGMITGRSDDSTELRKGDLVQVAGCDGEVEDCNEAVDDPAVGIGFIDETGEVLLDVATVPCMRLELGDGGRAGDAEAPDRVEVAVDGRVSLALSVGSGGMGGGSGKR